MQIQFLIFLHWLYTRSPVWLTNWVDWLFSTRSLWAMGKLIFGCIVLFFCFNWTYPLKLQAEYSQIILDKDSTLIHAYLTKDDKWRLKTELHEIIPQLKKTLIYKEDKYFYYHLGINPVSIGRAFFNNLFQMRTTSGASTITMQVVRLLEPKSRTYLNKFWEMFRSFQLEWYYTKEEILQLYFNLVPYGGNVEGIKSASLLYFDKMPQKLSLAEIVTLTIIPNRPTSLVIGKNNDLIQRERDKWLARFVKEGVFPKKAIRNAKAEILNATRQEAPQKAPHFCNYLRSLYPDQNPIFTHLHLEKQEKVQQLTQNYVRRLAHLNIYNAAVLVINNRTHAVEAYIGSPDFTDKKNAGEVDGIQAIRSPGSTLKPLAYGLAFDKGMLTAKTILADVPIDFNGFEPENFSRNFIGKVTAEEALARSLNIPAVKILQEIGLNSFISKLKKANFRQISLDQKKLGLSLVLGGCGVTLENLVGMYASFAHRGKYSTLQYFKTATKSDKNENTSLLSEAATYVITNILTQAQRPDLPNAFENTFRVPRVAWKTGTSFGRRDAWSIGYNEHYTVGVWIGNFSGEGVNHLVGGEIATPLLFEIFNTLDYNSPKNWFRAPKSLQVRWVCSETGLPPNSFCKNQVVDSYLPLISPSKRCEHLREVFISENASESYCLACLPNKGYRKAMYPNLSVELSAFYQLTGITHDRIPPHSSACTRLIDNQEEAPKITSPSADKQYIIDREDPPQMQLQCKAAQEVRKIYWYLNEKFYKVTRPNQAIFFTPELGLMKIGCTDDQGRQSQITIQVQYE